MNYKLTKNSLKTSIKLNSTHLNADSTTLTAIPVLQFKKDNHTFRNGYTQFKLNKAVFDNMIDHFDNRITGQDIPCNLDHKGGKSYGWVTKLYLNDNSNVLVMDIDMTPEGQKFVLEKAYRYFSAEFAREWTRQDTRQSFQNVFLGVALTNTPFFPQTEISLHKETQTMDKNEIILTLQKEHDIDIIQLQKDNGNMVKTIDTQKDQIVTLTKEKDDLSNKLEAIELSKKEDCINILFKDAVRDGKAVPAQEKMIKTFLSQFKSTEEAKSAVDGLPTIIKLDNAIGKSVDASSDDTGDDSYTVMLNRKAESIAKEKDIPYLEALDEAIITLRQKSTSKGGY